MHHEVIARHDRRDALELTHALDATLDRVLGSDPDTPAVLRAAMRHAVLGGGKRIRPRLLLASAEAIQGGPLDDGVAELALRAAVAVELVHAASLVHDDLPCFDDAALRRGRPTVHRAYGEPMAVLTGDALITLAFELLADDDGPHHRRALALVRLLAETTGSGRGIIGGQSLELHPARWDDDRPMAQVEDYHRRKTAALFEFAMKAAAVAVGHGPRVCDSWGSVGTTLGLAFQLIDDLLDLHADETTTGKTTGRDRALARPNGALVEGSPEALTRLAGHIEHVGRRLLELTTRPEPVLRLLDDLDTMLLGLGADEEANETEHRSSDRSPSPRTDRVALVRVA
ncbi:MAG: polyprenyl synthetase family protein [Myxococcota bacterium]